MIWVAIDRGKFFILPLSLSSLASNPNQGLRLADKRSLPCPNRSQWIAVRDELYEEIMNNAWNKEEKFFGQSYEDTNVLDSAVLIMPLVFFMHASDPRFVSTLKQILKTPARGGLTSNVRFLSPPSHSQQPTESWWLFVLGPILESRVSLWHSKDWRWSGRWRRHILFVYVMVCRSIDKSWWDG